MASELAEGFAGMPALSSAPKEQYVEFDEKLANCKSRFGDKSTYAGGEVLVQRLKAAPAHLLSRVHNSNELMRLIHYCHAESGNVKSVCIPYLPYARQDRVTANGTHNAVSVLAKLLATTGVPKFVTYDVHSNASVVAFEEAGLVLENRNSNPLIISYLDRLAAKALIPSREKVALVVPDKGGKAREKDQAEAMTLPGRPMCPIIHCDKVRGDDGNVKGLEVIVGESPAVIEPGTAVVIVDDICDGGRTFQTCAEALQKTYPNLKTDCTLHLWVTHGLFSKGVQCILDYGFTSIGCCDSFTPHCGWDVKGLIKVPVTDALEMTPEPPAPPPPPS